MELKESIEKTLSWVSKLREKHLDKACRAFYAKDYDKENAHLEIVSKCDKVIERLKEVRNVKTND